MRTYDAPAGFGSLGHDRRDNTAAADAIHATARRSGAVTLIETGGLQTLAHLLDGMPRARGSVDKIDQTCIELHGIKVGHAVLLESCDLVSEQYPSDIL